MATAGGKDDGGDSKQQSQRMPAGGSAPVNQVCHVLFEFYVLNGFNNLALVGWTCSAACIER